MAKPISFGGIQFGATTESLPDDSSVVSENSTAILVVGDFSGRGQRLAQNDADPIRGRRLHIIDRDNLEEVLERLKVELRLTESDDAANSQILRFKELDDFHPDALYQRVAVFEELDGLRRKLRNPNTFAAAAQVVKSWGQMEAAVEPAAETTAESAVQSHPAPLPQVQAPLAEGSLSGLLDQLIDQAETGAAADLRTLPVSAERSGFDALIQSIVQPHTLPGRDPREAELTACVDQVIQAHMRRVLHRPEFQALEAAWRSIRFLTYRLETDANLKIYLLDISQQELAADLTKADDLTATGFFKLLEHHASQGANRQPWNVIVGNFRADATAADAAWLARLNILARHFGATLVTGASEHLLGCESLAATPDPDDWKRPLDRAAAEAWNDLRQMPDAPWLGLAVPRFLLRQPYGKKSSPTEALEFEELDDVPHHEDYLWGNSAFLCAYLLAQALVEGGGKVDGELTGYVENLPLYAFEQDGEMTTQPCAEVCLSDRASENILSHGLIPVLSFREADRVQIPRMRSISAAGRPLTGRWSE